MISKEEAIGILSARSKILKNSKKTGKQHAAKALDMAIEALSQPPADQWIPCKTELPSLDEEVLIHCERDHYNVAYYDGSDFRAFDCLYDVEDVVAWKEFERYKGE